MVTKALPLAGAFRPANNVGNGPSKVKASCLVPTTPPTVATVVRPDPLPALAKQSSEVIVCQDEVTHSAEVLIEAVTVESIDPNPNPKSVNKFVLTARAVPE